MESDEYQQVYDREFFRVVVDVLKLPSAEKLPAPADMDGETFAQMPVTPWLPIEDASLVFNFLNRERNLVDDGLIYSTQKMEVDVGAKPPADIWSPPEHLFARRQRLCEAAIAAVRILLASFPLDEYRRQQGLPPR